jgi:hypothetical protein
MEGALYMIEKEKRKHNSWGYNNIHIKQDDQWKAAFITPYGLYIPKVMPFGLQNALATFQRCMHNTFWDILN